MLRDSCIVCFMEVGSDGKVIRKMIKDWSEEPWFEMVVHEYKDTEGLSECKELMKTPKQLRRDLGIDENLTSQRKNMSSMKDKAQRHQKYREAMRPLRKEVLGQLRE